MTTSPYTVPTDSQNATPEYEFPVSQSYAAPGENSYGWDGSNAAQELRVSPTGTPDANRLKTLPLYETRAGEGDPTAFYARYNEDTAQRSSVEHIDADGFAAIAPQLINPVPRPQPSAVPESRPTMRLSPHRYIFTRPFTVGGWQPLDGVHFSMADHRREYPVGGMVAPQKIRRNTYRIEPAPWDSNIVDVPAQQAPSPDLRVQNVDLPDSTSNGSFRLM